MVLRDAHWSGWAVFFVVTGATSFVSIFVVAFAFDFTLTRNQALWIVGACVGAGILVPTLIRIARSGKRKRLVIDWHAARFSREPDSVNVDINDIKTIRLRTRGTSTRINERPWYKHIISGVEESGTEHELLIAKGFREKGDSLRDWFAERFEAAGVESDQPRAGGAPNGCGE